MKHLIDKATIVAEINRVLNSYDSNEITSGRYALVKLRDFLDTIETTEDEHWQEVIERASIAAMQGTITILGNSDRTAFREIVVDGFKGNKKTYPNEIAEFAYACANALVEQLKKNEL